MQKFRFGFIPFPAAPLTAIESGVIAEKNGFDSLWVPDGFVDIGPPAGLNPWVVLSAVAIKTHRIRLGSGVTDVQRNHPARTAQLVATLDDVSRGRGMLGIGAGEFMSTQPFGLPWETAGKRIARLVESIKIMRGLWTATMEKPFTFAGSHYKLTKAFLSQPPKQKPYPRIYVGAYSSRELLEVAGKWGDGWYCWLNTPHTYKRRWSIVRKAAESVGRLARTIEPWSNLMVAFPRTSSERRGALLSGKILLVVERTILASLGYPIPRPWGHQNMRVSRESVNRILAQAKKVPDDVVHETMAIGTDEVHEKIEEFAKAGLRNFAVADLLAPNAMKRTLSNFRRVINHYA